MPRRILLALAGLLLAAPLAFLPQPAVAGNATSGGNCNGYWRHFDYDPSIMAGPASAKMEWHCNHFNDGDLELTGWVDTGALDPGWCVQIVLDAPLNGNPQDGHADAQILRNCKPHSRVYWPSDWRRVQTNTASCCGEKVFRVQVALFSQDWSPEYKLTYFPRCRYLPGFEVNPSQCDQWNPWGPSNNANSRYTLQRDGDYFRNHGGGYWWANS